MPIYEYVCDDCRHELEALQGMNDAVLIECPECGHAALRRKISAAAFRLKGSGWYETDFKKDNQRNLAGDKGDKSGQGEKTAKAGGNNSDAGGKTDKKAQPPMSSSGSSAKSG